MADNLTVEQRSRTMSRIRGKDTGPEVALRRALWAAGVRGYRTHVRAVAGRPDLCWQGRRVAVFVDGAFWHGHPSAFTAGKSGGYWDAKIARNVARDRAADEELRSNGWTVLRFWDFEVRKNLENCVREIAAALGNDSLP
jgi:DNA mismatch endonuclease (patch repair protein)